MQTNRRNWLKQVSFGIAGIGLAKIPSYAAPVTVYRDQHPADELILLNSNENPYGPSPMAAKAMQGSFTRSNRYYWNNVTALITALAQKNKAAEDNILLGAGSTEILDIAVQLAALQSGNVVTAEPSYNYWTEMAQNRGLKKITVPLTAYKKIDMAATLRSIQPDTRLVYICNPNNPTGTICDRTALLHFIQEASKKTLVVVDEAYLDYTDEESFAEETIHNSNLIVVKTFSKIFGLAGARIGYAVAHASTINKMAQLQSWPNGSVSVVSAAAALASLKDTAFVDSTRYRNEQVKEYTVVAMGKLKIHCIPSHSNFIYFSLADYKKDFFGLLASGKIAGTRIYEQEGQWSRITIGTLQEMQLLIRAIS